MLKNRVIETAMSLFSRCGYEGTSMSDIAGAVNVTKAALYYHFRSKEELYVTAMRATTTHLIEDVDRATAGIDDPAARLRAVVHAHLDLFRKEPDLIRALYHNLLTPSVPARSLVTDEPDTPLHRALCACAEAGYLDPEEIPDVFVLLRGGIEYLGVRWLLAPEGPPPTLADGNRLLGRTMPKLPEAPSRRRPRHGAWGVTLVAVIHLAIAIFTNAYADTDPVVDDPTWIDVIPGRSDLLTLESCIDEIVAFNAGIQAERLGRDQLAGQLWQARAVGLPRLDLVGAWSRSRDPSFALDETFGATEIDDAGLGGFLPRPEDIPPQTFWRASVDATWDLNPSQIVNAVGGAKLGAERQEALIAAAEHRLIERGVETYARILRTWESVRAAEAEVKARQEFLDITRHRHRLDVATALDTLQAAVSLANVMPTLRRARGDLVSVGAELNVLMGRPVRSPLRLAPSVPVETDEIDEDLAVDLATTRPDVRELDELAAIQRKNRGVQRSEARPSLALAGSYGFVARQFTDLGDDGKDTWRASATVTVPIFDGFLTRGKVREVEATIRRTELEREERARAARADVLAIVVDLDVAREDHAAARLNTRSAEDALRFATLRYENGKADYLSVLNAQSERAVARQNLIRARYDVLTRTAALKRAMGISPIAPLSSSRDAWKNRTKGQEK